MGYINFKYLFVLFFFALYGCAIYNGEGDVQTISDDPDVQDSTALLAQSAKSASDSLKELAQIEKTANPPKSISNPLDPNIIRMPQIVSMDWTGPIEPLVRKIAEMSDYNVRVIEIAPPIPIVVSINAKDTQLAYILRDANFQCGNKASINVYPSNKMLELRYSQTLR